MNWFSLLYLDFPFPFIHRPSCRDIPTPFIPSFTLPLWPDVSKRLLTVCRENFGYISPNWRDLPSTDPKFVRKRMAVIQATLQCGLLCLCSFPNILCLIIFCFAFSATETVGCACIMKGILHVEKSHFGSLKCFCVKTPVVMHGDFEP